MRLTEARVVAIHDFDPCEREELERVVADAAARGGYLHVEVREGRMGELIGESDDGGGEAG